MKKIVLTSLLSVAALGAYAQGELVFTDYHGGTLQTEIYSPSTASPTTLTPSINGNTTTDLPKGSQTVAQMYPGSVPLGGSAVNGSGASGIYQNGNNWKAQLEALGNGASSSPGVAPALSSLLPVTQYTAGLVTTTAILNAGEFSAPATPAGGDPGIANSGGGAAWVATAAWYDAAGTGDATLAAAQADKNGIWGESAEVFMSNLYEPVSGVAPAPGQVPYLPTDTFAVQTVGASSTPEPSSIAFGVMAAGAFLARRRKS